MPKYRLLMRVTQFEHWFVEAESLEAAQDQNFEVEDTEMLEGISDEVIEAELWGDREDDDGGF